MRKGDRAYNDFFILILFCSCGNSFELRWEDGNSTEHGEASTEANQEKNCAFHDKSEKFPPEIAQWTPDAGHEGVLDPASHVVQSTNYSEAALTPVTINRARIQLTIAQILVLPTHSPGYLGSVRNSGLTPPTE